MLSTQDLQRIEHALQEEDRGKGVRIALTLAGTSDSYDRAADTAGLLLALVLGAATWALLPAADAEGGSWAGHALPFRFMLTVAATLAGFLGGVWSAHFWWPLRRCLTPRTQMRRAVAAAARRAFESQFAAAALQGAPARPMLLIYVSFYEQRATLLTHSAIEQALGPATLDQFTRDLTQLLACGDTADALCQIIRRAGEKAAALPEVSLAAEPGIPFTALRLLS